MSNLEVTLNLPPIVNTDETCTIADINKECSISISTASTISLESEEHDKHSTVNVVNSNDVIIGTVTQFHGPVTIVQQPQSQDPIAAKKSKAKLVTTDSAPLPSKDLPTCMSKRFLVTFATLTVILSLIALTVIFSVEGSRLNRDIDDDDGIDKQSSSISTTLSTTTSTPTSATTTPSATTSTVVTTSELDNKYYVTGHEFYRVAQWGGRSPLWETPITQPIIFTIVAHTAGIKCQSFSECSAQLHIIQGLHVSAGQPDIGYNFLIGGDGNIYEARGWYAQNFHRDSTIGIAFMGNFVFDEPTELMIDAFDKLLELGVKLKLLPETFQIIAHNHTAATLSPGQHIYRVIKNYSNFYPGMLPQMKDIS